MALWENRKAATSIRPSLAPYFLAVQHESTWIPTMLRRLHCVSKSSRALPPRRRSCVAYAENHTRPRGRWYVTNATAPNMAFVTGCGTNTDAQHHCWHSILLFTPTSAYMAAPFGIGEIDRIPDPGASLPRVFECNVDWGFLKRKIADINAAERVIDACSRRQLTDTTVGRASPRRQLGTTIFQQASRLSGRGARAEDAEEESSHPPTIITVASPVPFCRGSASKVLCFCQSY